MDEIEKPAFTLGEHVNYKISEYDLALHPKIQNIDTTPRHVLSEALWECGMNTRGYVWETIKIPHRTLSGDERDGIVYCGRERCDREWKSSGCATMEGMIDNTFDYELRNDLKRLNR